jgi:hypothetical protein
MLWVAPLRDFASFVFVIKNREGDVPGSALKCEYRRWLYVLTTKLVWSNCEVCVNTHRVVPTGHN